MRGIYVDHGYIVITNKASPLAAYLAAEKVYQENMRGWSEGSPIPREAQRAADLMERFHAKAFDKE